MVSPASSYEYPEFSRLSKLILSDLIFRAGVVKLDSCRRSSVLFRCGEPADHVYFLESGLVTLVKEGRDDKALLLTILQAGDVFGADAVLGQDVWDMSARVLEEGIIYQIPRDLFAQFCDDHPGLWRELTLVLLSRIREMKRKIGMMFMADVEKRILWMLVELAEAYRLEDMESSESPVPIPLTQEEMSKLIGATRETTSTALNKLQRKMLVKLGRKLMVVPCITTVRGALNEMVPACCPANKPEA